MSSDGGLGGVRRRRRLVFNLGFILLYAVKLCPGGVVFMRFFPRKYFGVNLVSTKISTPDFLALLDLTYTLL